jgi:hypothetical protein
MYQKRLIICLIGGVTSAIICVSGGFLLGLITNFTLSVLATSIANRILIGFVIGISNWKTNYLFHGAVIGLVVSLSTSIGSIADDMLGFTLYTLAGIVYGMLIEYLATKLFKAPMRNIAL